MSTAERVNKYYDDGKALLGGGNCPKIMAEIRKLTTYLQKHQTESIPEGVKTKLFGIIELYYRYVKGDTTNESLLECVSSLLSSYLQLPEGKLVAASHKKKALQWIQELNAIAGNNGLSGKTGAAASTSVSTWSLESINDDGTITLLNLKNSELWKEDYMPVNLSEHMATILSLQGEMEEAAAVIIELDEGSDTIVGVKASS